LIERPWLIRRLGSLNGLMMRVRADPRRGLTCAGWWTLLCWVLLKAYSTTS